MRSLRSRIYLLAILTCLLLAGSAGTFIIVLRNTESSLVSAAQTHLTTIATSLSQDCANRAAYELQQSRPLALTCPRDPGSDQVLSLMTSVLLRHEIGIEGGFYSTVSEDLLGYAFPTHEGPGPHKEIPGREKPTITDLARKASSTGAIQTLRFIGARDVVIFAAAPIQIEGRKLGSTWMMERMPNLNERNRIRLGIGAAAFVLGALLSTLIAFLVVAEVRQGVTSVSGYLHGLGSSLAEARPAPARLAEFESVLKRIDLLANTLNSKIERERELETELRHKDRLSSLGQFAAGIAHELRNPLTTIRLRTQMSTMSTAEEPVRRNGEIVMEEISRLDAMIERLLYFSRPVQLNLSPVDAQEICSIALSSHEDRCKTLGIDLRCSAPSGLVVSADRNHLRQVLDNILLNAIEAAASQPTDQRRVELTIAAKGEWAEICVRDSGPGFTSDAALRALDPFFTTKPKGTGLGLSIAYEIVEAHRGELQLRNGSNMGAEVVVLLPLVKTPMEKRPLVPEGNAA